MKLEKTDINMIISELNKSKEVLNTMIKNIKKYSADGVLTKDELLAMNQQYIVIVDDPDNFDQANIQPVKVEDLPDFEVVEIYKLDGLYMAVKINEKE